MIATNPPYTFISRILCKSAMNTYIFKSDSNTEAVMNSVGMSMCRIVIV